MLLELMKIILLDAGLGAKTRVGLGQFVPYNAINHANNNR